VNAVLRAPAILADPAAEWVKIAKERGNTAHLFTGYVALLALVPAVFGFIGACVVGEVLPHAGLVRAPLLTGLGAAVFDYVTTCASVLVLGLLIDMLAPMFDGRRNFASAFKLAVFSYTPVWLSGIFLLAPGLRFLGLLSFYGAYMLWLGMPPIMKSPPQRALPYCTAIVGCACVLAFSSAAARHALFGSAAL